MTNGQMVQLGSLEEEDSIDFGDSHENFDEIYDNAEEHDIGNMEHEHGSVLMHLLSQVSFAALLILTLLTCYASYRGISTYDLLNSV